MTLDVLDTFSGIGGFAVGLETAGMRTVAFCEALPIRRHLLAHHFPGVPQYDDIRTLTGERLRADGVRCDVICGGFPCQDLSFAGNGAGLAGERSGLWFELARLVREVRPRFVILENVAALLVRGLGAVVGELAALGYDLWWDCIPASAVGAPHRRDRIWIVAYSRSVEHEGFGDAFLRAIASELHGYAYESGEPGSTFDEEAPWGENDVFGAAWWWDERRAVAERGWRLAEPGMGGLADGVSTWLDALHGGFQEEPPLPRVAKDIPARVGRLAGLGDSVVPQIPAMLGRAILAALEEIRA